MRNGAWHITFILLLTAMTGCKKPFEPAPVTAITNFLVVDGNINIGVDIPTTIVLSRTKQLSDSILFDPETNASVYIEQEQGGSYSLSHFGNGIYRSCLCHWCPANDIGCGYRQIIKRIARHMKQHVYHPQLTALPGGRIRMLRYRCIPMIRRMIRAIIDGITRRYGTIVPPWCRHGE